MSAITVHTPSPIRHLNPSGNSTLPSPLPRLLHTPAGLALIELQGSLNHPPKPSDPNSTSISVGRLVFPDYRADDPSLSETGEGTWMKRVWMYVGEHQRLTGEVRKLGKPLGVMRRKEKRQEGSGQQGGQGHNEAGDLMEGFQNGSGGANDSELEIEDVEIAEIIRWKIVFSSRPEPVGFSGSD